MPTTMTSPSDSTARPDEAHSLLGRQLRALRESRNISLAAASRHLGGSQSKISRMERAESASRSPTSSGCSIFSLSLRHGNGGRCLSWLAA